LLQAFSLRKKSKAMSATKLEDNVPLTLYRGWLEPGKHVWSPFVIKLEARLRFAGVSYTTECGSTRTAPKGKIPYLECEDGTLGDSTLITKQLVDWGRLPDLNATLSPADKAHDHALRALLEDKLYFYHVQYR
jgi:glutathione S-transferase